MARLERRTGRGTLRIVARSEADAHAAADLAERAIADGSFGCDVVDPRGERWYFKRSALRGWPSARYAIKRRLLLRPIPCVREYRNLSWLRARSVQAPEPVAAGFLGRFGLPRFQLLLTRAIEGARTLDEFLATAHAPERAAVLDELARETARMHALRFVHHDLWPRNVLVTGPDEPSRVWFLDCRAGGPAPQLRGPAYDLACLLLRAPETMSADEPRRFLDAYVEERAAQGRPAERRRLEHGVHRERLRLAARLDSAVSRGIGSRARR